MGMTDEFETSLQVLRGFETDITVEVNEIKVTLPLKIFPSKSYMKTGFQTLIFHLFCKSAEICGIIYKAKYSSVCRSQTQEILFPTYGTNIEYLSLEYTLSIIRNIILKLLFCRVCVCNRLV
jgi:hypothetical protein